MSRPVNVLVAMRSAANAAFEAGADEGPERNPTAYEEWQRACDAVDAVAELIEAARAAECRMLRGSAEARRLAAALARVGGAQ